MSQNEVKPDVAGAGEGGGEGGGEEYLCLKVVGQVECFALLCFALLFSPPPCFLLPPVSFSRASSSPSLLAPSGRARASGPPCALSREREAAKASLQGRNSESTNRCVLAHLFFPLSLLPSHALAPSPSLFSLLSLLFLFLPRTANNSLGRTEPWSSSRPRRRRSSRS